MPVSFLNLPPVFQKIIFILLIAGILFIPFIGSAMALLAGLVVGLALGNPFTKQTGKAASLSLKVSVVGLGFGINLYQAAETGLSGLAYTSISLVGTLVVGFILGRLLGIGPKLTHLISAGTAICGGSAIAAVAPAIKAEPQEISVSLAIVFILNAVALFVFPVVGQALDLSQEQFGIWAAIAIHDTSSVVGAAARYGDEALQLATTLKLTRALWIVPMVIVSGFLFKNDAARAKLPAFILLFILASVLVTFLPVAQQMAPFILVLAKKGLLLSLFLIGASINAASIKSINSTSFWLGFILWIIVSLASLGAVLYFG
ncbi:YeiH family protein [Pontibacter arcticus]|uniref:Putative sulfate exporter family transporter n=1 Tax=Pontibacter arcticus TaxID=2080288 RepID=A0A364RE46_9BACT|nr:putative sulfate exporter family transporter [Pontibacter arcticus]RAU82515.1 putative sulfate exporter family transporter [Pontibacter arcticus]